MNQSTNLFINLAIYIVYFIFVYRSKYRGRNYVLLISSLFLVSSLCSPLYYNTSAYLSLTEGRINDISLIALIYLFVNFVVFLRPVLTYKVDRQIIVPNYRLLFYLGVFLGIVSILPFFENLKEVLNFNATKFADVYFEKYDENFNSRAHLSALGRICNGIVVWFQYFTPSLFFYMLVSKQKRIFILLSLLAFLNPVVLGLITGGRGELFQLILILVFNYLLFRQYFTVKQDRIIKIVGVTLCTIAAVALLFITFARAADDTSMAYEQIYRYLGEGFVNFGEKGWYVKYHTYGHSVINGTGDTFLKNISDYFDSRDYTYLGSITGMRMYVYYTVFGDYFIDFGWFGGFLFNAALASLFYYFVKGKQSHFSSLILFNLYAKIGFLGIYCYAYMYRIEFLFFTFLVVFFMRRFEGQTNEANIKKTLNKKAKFYAVK